MRASAWWLLLLPVAAIAWYATRLPGPVEIGAPAPPPVAAPRAPAAAPAPTARVSEAQPEASPTPAPGDAATLGDVLEGDVDPPRELILGALRGAIETYLPDRKLSTDQYARLADAVETLRGAREELRELDYTAENAERRRELVDALGHAVADFEYILEMSPGEFSDRVQPGVGLSSDAPGEPVPPPEYLDDLPPRG